MPYFLSLKKQQILNLSSAANYRLKDGGCNIISTINNIKKLLVLGLDERKPDLLHVNNTDQTALISIYSIVVLLNPYKILAS